MKKLALAFAVALVSLSLAVPARSSTYDTQVIRWSPGGSIFFFIDKYVSMQERGVRVVVDGVCISACTLLLGLIDNDRLCATPRGVFGFHTASNGEDRFDEEATKAIWWIYPPNVREWLERQSMTPDIAHPNVIYTEATRFVPACSP